MRTLALALALTGTIDADAGSWFSGDGVVINFDGYEGLGFAADPVRGELDSNVFRVTGASDGDGRFGGQHQSGDFARGTANGPVSGGGVYAFDVSNGVGSPDWALGIQPTSGDFTPGSLGLRAVLDGTSSLESVWLEFEIHQRNNGPRESLLSLNYSTGKAAADGHAPVQIDLNPTGGAATPAAQWTHLAYRILLDELTWSIGDVLEVSWAFDDGAGGGVRDEIAFDDIALRAVDSAHRVVEPPLLGMMLVACGIAAGLRTRRRAQRGRGKSGVD